LSDTVPDESVHGEHPVEVAASKEPSVDEDPADKAPVEEGVAEDVNETPLAEEPISVSEDPEPLCIELQPVLEESEAISFEWGNISKNDKKKKNARFTFDETHPAEECPTEVPAEEPPTEARVEEKLVEQL
jgi:hypothetical protein